MLFPLLLIVSFLGFVLVLTGSDRRTVCLGLLPGLAVAVMQGQLSLVDWVYPRDRERE